MGELTFQENLICKVLTYDKAVMPLYIMFDLSYTNTVLLLFIFLKILVEWFNENCFWCAEREVINSFYWILMCLNLYCSLLLKGVSILCASSFMFKLHLIILWWLMGNVKRIYVCHEVPDDNVLVKKWQRSTLLPNKFLSLVYFLRFT